MYKTWLLIGFDRPDDDPVIRRLQQLGLYSRIDPNRRTFLFIWLDNNIPTIGFESEEACDLFFESFIKRNNRENLRRAFSSLPRPQLERFHDAVFRHKQMSIRFRYDFLEEKSHFDNPYYRRFLSIRSESAKTPTHIGIRPRVVYPRQGDRKNLVKEKANYLLLDPNSITINNDEDLRLLYGTCDNESKAVLLPPWSTTQASTSYLNENHQKVRRSLRKKINENIAVLDQPFGLFLWKLMDDSLFRDVLSQGAWFDIEMKDGAQNQVLCFFNDGDTLPIKEQWRNYYLKQNHELPGPQWLKAIITSIAKDYREPFDLVNVGIQQNERTISWDIHKLPRTPIHPAPEEGMYKILEELKEKNLKGTQEQEFRTNVLRPAAQPDRNPSHVIAESQFIAHYFRCPWSKEVSHNGDTKLWRRFVKELVDELVVQKQILGVLDKFENEEDIWKAGDKWMHTPNESIETVKLWRLRLPAYITLRSASSNVLDDNNTKLDHGLYLS